MIIFAFLIDNSSPFASNKNLKIDEDLFKRIGEDDVEAFERLYILTERTLYAYVLSLTKNHQDTLDIMQETYLKIRGAAHLYKAMGKPLAWMFTIAKNLYRSQLRLKENSPKDSLVDLENSSSFSYVSDPIDKLVLTSALDNLKEEEREIILLYAISGLKHREIAKSLGIPLSTALSKYHRGLKKTQGNS